MRLRSVLVASAMFFMASFSMAQFSLSTQYAANNSFAGNTFDVVATQAVTISSFDVNLLADPAVPQTISIYYREGTAVGNEDNPAGWTLLGTDTGVISNGLDVPTPVDVGGLMMTAGQTYGIYVDLETQGSLAPSAGFVSADAGDLGGSVIAYTNGGPTDYTDGVMTITTNTGQGTPAFTSVFFPREWNGTINYGPSVFVPTLGEYGLAALILLMMGAAVFFMKRRA